jgi:RsiW-degrading membrane proteinase PrsW (M82 family)
LTLISALPVIIVFFWFKYRKSAITLPWFLISAAAGIISFLIAAFVQTLFIPAKQGGFWAVFYTIFIRIALVEESSRLLTLIPFLGPGKNSKFNDSSYGAALGLVAGLGFVVIESAYHGITALNVILLRLITAAPLHGACGLRAGLAVSIFRKHPARALFLFVSAIIIHGTYNLIIVSPAYPSAFAIIIAYAALFSSLGNLKSANREKEISNHDTGV